MSCIRVLVLAATGMNTNSECRKVSSFCAPEKHHAGIGLHPSSSLLLLLPTRHEHSFIILSTGRLQYGFNVLVVLANQLLDVLRGGAGEGEGRGGD